MLLRGIVRNDCVEWSEAEKIVNEYGGILVEAAKLGTVRPVSMLPYPKERIKAAILECLSGETATGTLTDKTRDSLEVGYMELATFVDDEQAAVVIDWEKTTKQRPRWLKELTTAELHQKLQNEATSEKSEKALEIYRAVAEEEDALKEQVQTLRKLRGRRAG